MGGWRRFSGKLFDNSECGLVQAFPPRSARGDLARERSMFERAGGVCCGQRGLQVRQHARRERLHALRQ